MSTSFTYKDESSGGKIILSNIRLARSPHWDMLKDKWGTTKPEDVIYAIYLNGTVTVPNPDFPLVQAVKGFAAHVVHRQGDSIYGFEFNPENNTLIINPKAEVYYFAKRVFGTLAAGQLTGAVRDFAAPKSISSHATIFSDLLAPNGPYASHTTGTCTDRLECGHPTGTKTTVSNRIG